jgi:hypothetical protein
MEREKITLESDDVNTLMYDNTDYYRHVELITDYTDLEKSYNDCTLIIQRKSDNKYFSSSGIIDSPYHSNEDDIEFEEVNKVIKTETWE